MYYFKYYRMDDNYKLLPEKNINEIDIKIFIYINNFKGYLFEQRYYSVVIFFFISLNNNLD